MKKIFLTFGPKKYIISLAKKNKQEGLEFISQPNQSEYGILSKAQLLSTKYPVKFQIIDEVLSEEASPKLIVLYYFVGNEKASEIVQKSLNLNKEKLKEFSIYRAIWMQEIKDLKRYVLLLSFEDNNGYQSFINSNFMLPIKTNFYSNFQLIYESGLGG